MMRYILTLIVIMLFLGCGEDVDVSVIEKKSVIPDAPYIKNLPEPPMPQSMDVLSQKQ